MKIIFQVACRVKRFLGEIVREYRAFGYYPLHTAIFIWIRNNKVSYTNVKKREWNRYKKSDTVFILGSGPSLNKISQGQWRIIEQHDSFGINYAFLLNRPTTYFYLGYEPSSNDILLKSFTPEIRKTYSKSLWFVPYKIIYRLVHPRILPDFFPFEPHVAFFDCPHGIVLKNGRRFTAEDFSITRIYRGSMGLALHMVDVLGYKNIVLLGVDLHTYAHFYDDYDVMKEERKIAYKNNAPTDNFDAWLPKKEGKSQTMEEYYYAIDQLYFKPKGVNLYVGNSNNLLTPRIPVYPEFL